MLLDGEYVARGADFLDAQSHEAWAAPDDIWAFLCITRGFRVMSWLANKCALGDESV